jgi:4-hydroxy-3-methylbut-2-en-1-yl diphosphate reductase
MKVFIVSPRGFCAGVRRAIDIVNLALDQNKPPIYVRKEIVHNKMVVEDFKKRGVIFINDLEEAPQGSCVIFSAHGIAPAVRAQAKEKNHYTIDATCPLVTKVHLEVHRFLKEGYSLILIGHKDHEEVEGTMGEAPGKITLVESPEHAKTVDVPNPEKVMVLTQTTLSVDETKATLNEIRKRFPHAQTPAKEDICYATQNRQDAVRDLLKNGIEVLLVVGSKNSSNSKRLCEVARDGGSRAYLIDDASEIDRAWFENVSVVGITAGASAPEYLVQNVVSYLKTTFNAEASDVFVREENVVFSLPKELVQSAGKK